MQKPFYFIIGMMLWLMTIIPIHAQSGGEIVTEIGQVNQAIYSPDGQMIALATTTGVWLYDANHLDSEPILLEGYDMYPIEKIVFSPSGRRLAGYGQHRAMVWYIPTGELTLQIGGWDVTQMVFDDNELRFIILAERSNDIAIWNARDGAFLYEIDPAYMNIPSYERTYFQSLAIHPDGSYLMFMMKHVSTDSGLVLLDVHTTEQIGLIPLTEWSEWGEESHWIEQIIFSPNGDYFAIYTNYLASDVYPELYESYVILWDSTNRIILNTIYHRHHIDWIDFSPDGQTILSVWDNYIGIWDVQTGQLIKLLVGYSAHLEQATFSPDGSRILAVDEVGNVYEWDVANQQARCVYCGIF